VAEIFVVGFHVTICSLRAVGEGDAGADDAEGRGAAVERVGVADELGVALVAWVALGAAACGDVACTGSGNAALEDGGAGVTADPLALGAGEGAKTATFCVSDSPE